MSEAVFILNVLDEVEFGTHRFGVDTTLLNTYNNGVKIYTKL